MKRFLVILTVISLLIGVIVFPASASSVEVDNSMINYFDYHDADTQYIVRPESSAASTITFPLNRVMYIRYIDCIIASAQGFKAVYLIRGNQTNALTTISLGNGIYRVYGEVGGGSGAWSDEFSFQFTLAAASQITFYSIRYSLNAIEFFNDVGTLYVTPRADGSTSSVTMSNSSTSVSIELPNYDYISNYNGYVYVGNWRKYDSIDVTLDVNAGGLDSIYVESGNVLVPFSVTVFDSSNAQIGYIESDYDTVLDENVYYFLNQHQVFTIVIHIDLTGIQRTSSAPYIRFSGSLTPNYNLNSISLYRVSGSFYAANQSLLANWFTDLKLFFSELFTPDDDVKEEISTGISNNESTEQDIMTGIDDIGSDPADIDIDVIIEQSGADTNLIAAFFSVFFNNVIILRTFWLAALFIVIGYIFHGQR